MNILITTPYSIWPVNFGGAVRTFNIVRSLAEIGHNVTLLSREPITQQYRSTFTWRSFKSAGLLGHFWNFSFIKELTAILNDDFDLILMEFPYQAFMVIPQAKKHDIPVIYDAHNVEMDRFLSMGSRPKSFIVGLSESYSCKNAKAVLAVSDEDMSIFQSRCKTPVKLLPNGVDLSTFVFSEPNESLLEKYGLTDKKVVMYFGAFDYPPNVEALKYLVEKIWPKVLYKIKDASLLVVGKTPPAWLKSSKNIVVTGSVDNIVEHIQLAQVVAVPLFSGGGSRLKIIEALACGKTVLSTEFGAAGLSNKKGQGLVLTSEDGFSEELIRLLELEYIMINRSSREIAVNFSWSKLIKGINWREIIGIELA